MEFEDVDDNHNIYPNFERGDSDERRANYKALFAAGIQWIPSSVSITRGFPMSHYDDIINYVMYLMAERNSLPGDHKVVFVWDIEEITMLASNCIMWYTVRNPGLNFGLFNTLIGRILLNVNFYGGVELVNIEDAIDDGTEKMKHVVPQCEALEQFYNEISNGMRDDDPIINYELVKKCGMVEKIVDLYNAAAKIDKDCGSRWKSVKPCLELINKKSNESTNKYTNVVICKEKLGHAIGQLLISSNSKYINIENVYSTCDLVWKETIFERIQKRFGEKCVLVYMTSKHPSKVVMPRTIQVPVFQLLAQQNFRDLPTILSDYWLQ